jgi:hypothetical protein
MEETNQDSLASYLGMNHKQLHSLLRVSGLVASLHGKQSQLKRSQGYSLLSWSHLLVNQRLNGYFYTINVNKKRYFWIGLGSLKK